METHTLLTSLLLCFFVVQIHSDQITKTCTKATNVDVGEKNWDTDSGKVPADVSLYTGEQSDVLRVTEFGFTSADIPGSVVVDRE